MEPSTTRRRMLELSGLAGVGALAGCVTGQSDSGAGDATTEPPTEAAETTTETSTDESCETETDYTPIEELSSPDSVEDWLSDANGYDGEPVSDAPPEAVVRVGEPADDGLAFDPPVIQVRPGTTVVWEWTDHGGPRNVAALDGSFDSGRPNATARLSYSHYFLEPGTYRFVSEPQREDGMKGAVVVTEAVSTGNETVDQWLYDVDNFDGSVADRTGADRATVTVGAEGNGGAFAFDPPVLRVSTGTPVEWEWTGDGGAHDVFFEEVDVSSGDPVADPGTHFEHTFEAAGTYLYACRPHEALGMRGAVIVE